VLGISSQNKHTWFLFGILFVTAMTFINYNPVVLRGKRLQKWKVCRRSSEHGRGITEQIHMWEYPKEYTKPNCTFKRFTLSVRQISFPSLLHELSINQSIKVDLIQLLKHFNKQNNAKIKYDCNKLFKFCG